MAELDLLDGAKSLGISSSTQNKPKPIQSRKKAPAKWKAEDEIEAPRRVSTRLKAGAVKANETAEEKQKRLVISVLVEYTIHQLNIY